MLQRLIMRTTPIGTLLITLLSIQARLLLVLVFVFVLNYL